MCQNAVLCGNGLTVNPLQNKLWFLSVCRTSHLKTLREKKKLPVMSNFSFSHRVFYPFGELSSIFIKMKIVFFKLFQFGRVKNWSFAKGLQYVSVSVSVSEQRPLKIHGSSTLYQTTKF